MARIISVKADCFDKIKVEVMKKILASLIILNCSLANAYEYSSDHDDRGRYEHEREEWYESNSRRAPLPRYQQNYQQPPIQIFLSPDMNDYRQHRDHSHRRHYDNRYQNDRRYQEERYWQQRREELEQTPQRRSNENPFYRDDTHW